MSLTDKIHAMEARLLPHRGHYDSFTGTYDHPLMDPSYDACQEWHIEAFGKIAYGLAASELALSLVALGGAVAHKPAVLFPGLIGATATHFLRRYALSQEAEHLDSLSYFDPSSIGEIGR